MTFGSAAPRAAASIFQVTLASKRSTGSAGSANTPGRSSAPSFMAMRASPPVSLATSSTLAFLQARAADRIGLAAAGRALSDRPLDAAADAVVQRRIERAVPARVEPGDDAFRTNVGEQLAQGRAERNAAGDAGHQADVEALGLEFAAIDLLAFGLVPGHAQVALRPADAVAGDEAEAVQLHRRSIALALGVEAALDLLEGERLDAAVEAQRHGAQHDVDGRAFGAAFVHVEPAAQRAVALAQLERQADVAAQLAHVGARQLGVDAAAPVLPVAGAGEERLVEAAAHAEAVAPFGRRRRIEAKAMLAQAVAHDDVDAREDERRRLARLVDPARRAVADHEFVLPEEPVGDRAAAVGAAGAAAEVEAGDVDVAGRVAADVEARRFDQQLLEARLEGEQRMGREAPRRRAAG